MIGDQTNEQEARNTKGKEKASVDRLILVLSMPDVDVLPS